MFEDIETSSFVTVIFNFFVAAKIDVIDTGAEDAISLRLSPACDKIVLSIRLVTVGIRMSATLTALESSACDIGVSSRLRRVSKSSIIRVSITLGGLRVTMSRGFF